MAELGSPQTPDWSNPSVLAFAAGADPLIAATDAARKVLDAARATGMNAPPVDVIELAKLLGLVLRPVNSITDAAVTAIEGDLAAGPLTDLMPAATALALVYNPSRPRGRLRFSIAHEIAHALFPDVADVTRHRTATGALPDAGHDAWELELLCNVIAAELLLPDEAVAGLLNIDTDMNFIMETRRRWDVSTEALLRRLVSSSARGLTLLAASGAPSSRPGAEQGAALRIEYAIGPGAALWPRGSLLPEPIAAAAPVAIGETTRVEFDLVGRAHALQTVGAPPYPGQTRPRMLALDEPVTDARGDSRVSYETGDITAVNASSGPVVLAHVVSDAARAWSRRGVAAALARAYPRAAAAFRAWAVANPDNLRLGHVHHVDLTQPGGPQVTVASMVAQAGFGPGVATRLQYDALHECLGVVGSLAHARGAQVHLPRIGAGQAGGRWDLIEADIGEQLTERGIPVIVYTLGARTRGTRSRT